MVIDVVACSNISVRISVHARQADDTYRTNIKLSLRPMI